MPFEKQPPLAGCERRALSTLFLTVLLLLAALILGLIGAALAGETAGAIARMMENEAIHAFLGLGAGE